MAIRGDTLVAGARYEEVAEGTGYVCTRNGTTWTQEALLKASNANVSDLFGWSVSISGDSIVVGAYSERSGVTGGPSDNSQTYTGAVYTWQ